MEDNEIHYLTYDPDAIWDAMIDAYLDAGGDVLYPGDEKEMLMRGVQSMKQPEKAVCQQQRPEQSEQSEDFPEQRQLSLPDSQQEQ